MPSPEPAILYMNQATVLGGAERILLLAMEQARRRGYRPLLACPPDGLLPQAARERGFTVLPADFAWMENRLSPGVVAGYLSGIAREGRRVKDLCREHGVALLHPMSPVAGLYATKAAKDLRLPVVLHMHDAQRPKRARRAAIRFQARTTSAFLCVSECVRSMVCGIGIPRGKTSVLYNAIDGSFFGPSPAPAPEVSGPGPHFGLFGQIVPWKGQHVFLEAGAILAEKMPTARFWVIGTLAHPADQPYLDRLKEMVSCPPLAGRATLAGYQPDARGWMAAMDAVAHTSVAPEAFGLVIAEAMALGKPVVASNTGGPAEIVEEGVTGRLVPPGDALALAAALEQAVGDPAMGARGAESVRARFTPDRLGEDLVALYRRILPAG